MGGVLILSSLVLATLLLADLTNQYVWLVLAVTIGFAAIGFVDDWRKLTGRNSKGLPGATRLRWEFTIGLAAGAFLYLVPHFDTTLYFPFFKNLHVELGAFYIPFAAVLLVGASNAVNLTDGLDGLAIGPVMTTAFTYGIFAYATGNAKLAEYLQVPYITGTGELAIFCAALVCAGLGFLFGQGTGLSFFTSLFDVSLGLKGLGPLTGHMGPFEAGQDHGGLLGGPALRAPSKAFFAADSVCLVTNGEISIRLDAVLTFGVFPIAHAWEAGFGPLHDSRPLGRKFIL
jgi:phospho-N-acetylmuramoyl-pentapeptide-transferase